MTFEGEEGDPLRGQRLGGGILEVVYCCLGRCLGHELFGNLRPRVEDIPPTAPPMPLVADDVARG